MIAKPVVILSKSLFVYLILCTAIFLMLRMVADYSALRDDVDFLRFKQAYVGYWWWKSAFYIHVFTAIFALMAGPVQFSETFLRDHRPLHRIIGRLYAYDILAINFPAGMVLAVFANGMLPGRIAFVLLDSLWFSFTLIAVVAARHGQIARHREFMIRSYSMTFFSNYSTVVEAHSFAQFSNRSSSSLHDRCLDGICSKPAAFRVVDPQPPPTRIRHRWKMNIDPRKNIPVKRMTRKLTTNATPETNTPAVSRLVEVR